MKRLFPAAILALLIHMLFLYMESGWLNGKHPVQPKIDSVTMTLVQIKKEFPKPILQSPSLPEKVKPVKKKIRQAIKKPSKKEKPISKPVIPYKAPEKQIYLKETVSSAKDKPIEPTGTWPAQPENLLDKSIPETTVPDNNISKATIIKTAIPLYKLNPRPEYPRLARKRGYQGTVVLDVLVDKNGRVSDLKLATSSKYPILDKKAMASVKKWIFEPGKKGNNKVDMWVKVPIRFELK